MVRNHPLQLFSLLEVLTSLRVYIYVAKDLENALSGLLYILEKPLSRSFYFVLQIGRIMILKGPPQIFYTGGVLTQEIGSPEDYVKNKNNGNFPDHIDLTIPAG